MYSRKSILGLGLMHPRTAVAIDALRTHIINISMYSKVMKVIKIIKEKTKVKSKIK